MLPMFPLGTNIFPFEVVPLHIFEDRYRTLMDDIIASSALDERPATFGIVMIERGSETGGGDVRSAVATRVDVLHSESFDDGRWGIVVAGVERLDVVRWHEDDPYPIADVVSRDRHDTGGSLAEVEDMVEESLRLGAKIFGGDVQELAELSGDPIERLDQLCALAPLTTFDRQQILEALTTDRQIELLAGALADKLELLRAEVGRRTSD